ncbi:MAG: radical SAM protein [Deltaproteobacteria bacterium]|nr:MAG: radical SAM protein [Deltaproteobacteria bacterium]
MAPSYLKLTPEELRARAEQAAELLRACRLCPRECGVDRIAGETGFCQTGGTAGVAAASAHFGEEAPLVGKHGSGTIFLSSCNLRCSFCQNYDISHRGEGVAVTPERMAAMMIDLAEKGCHNINFVTPTHVVPQILEALVLAVDRGLSVPLVYNSSGYERVETLSFLDGIFDIYMPDFKFWDNKWGERFCRVPDYRERAVRAVKEMHRQVGDLVVDREGVAVRGLLVRHLVMPNGVAGTEEIMSFLSESVSRDTYINVMDQYRPCGTAMRDEWINRRLTAREYRDAVAAAKRAGLTRLDPRDRVPLIFRF